MSRAWRTVLSLAMACLLAGCAGGGARSPGGTGSSGGPQPRAEAAYDSATSPVLTMPSRTMHHLAGGAAWPNGADGGWEFLRNDDRLNLQPAYASFGLAEIRTRQYLRTINGRPSETSITTIRSLQPRVDP